MSILVTGGTGFIGAYIIRELLNSKHEEQIIVYDVLPDKRMLGINTNKIRIVRGDVLDFAKLCKTIKDFDIDRIIHLAYLLIDACELEPWNAVRVNCEGVVNIFEIARIFDIKKIVMASSTGVYGPAKYYGEDKFVNEDDVCLPTTIYGACKVFNEFLGKKYIDNYGLDIVMLRPTIVYGLGRTRGGFTFANDMIVYSLLKRPIEVPYGDQELDWVYVKDVANAFIKALFHEKTRHHIFNIGGYRYTLREAANIVSKRIPGAKITIKEGKLGWVSKYSIDRARNELGYIPSFDLEKAIEDMLSLWTSGEFRWLYQ